MINTATLLIKSVTLVGSLLATVNVLVSITVEYSACGMSDDRL